MNPRPTWKASLDAVSLALIALASLSSGAHAQSHAIPRHSTAFLPPWMEFAHSPQHDAFTSSATQPLQRIRWSSPVDLQPQYSGLIHYGSPLVSSQGTILITVKVGATDGFQVEGHAPENGALLWTQTTDYRLPPHDWTPSCGPTLTPNGALMVPGAGGTVYRRANTDSARATVTQLAFYGLATYQSDPSTYDAVVMIDTPITSDSHGNVFFGFAVLGYTAIGLSGGLARIGADGTGNWVAASTAAADGAIVKTVYNCAPSLNHDESVVYIAVNDSYGFGTGYLLGLDSQTLETVYQVRLKDNHYPTNDALLVDDGTASPQVGPDGDVYFGVLENPFSSNHLRGWMLHFDAALAQTKIAGAFGWDNTPSVVPLSAVPFYAGPSPYLILTKYNNYVEGGGDGVNKMAVLDPNVSMIDPISGATVMQEILTIAGPTPDWGHRDSSHPDAVREWCVNTAVVDPKTKASLVNSEDGSLYRWDFPTNTLTQAVALTAGVGEAYTPTLAGPNGVVYAINAAVLFAVGD
jgi:hypothetical protein